MIANRDAHPRTLRELSLTPQPGKNKYELVIVAARESRHLNELSRITGEPLPAKVTTIALDRVLLGEVEFTYKEPEPAEEASAEE